MQADRTAVRIGHSRVKSLHRRASVGGTQRPVKGDDCRQSTSKSITPPQTADGGIEATFPVITVAPLRGRRASLHIWTADEAQMAEVGGYTSHPVYKVGPDVEHYGKQLQNHARVPEYRTTRDASSRVRRPCCRHRTKNSKTSPNARRRINPPRIVPLSSPRVSA